MEAAGSRDFDKIFVSMEKDPESAERAAAYYEEREEMAVHILESLREAFPLD